MNKSIRGRVGSVARLLTFVWGVLPTICTGVPYDPDEVQRLQAFLQSPSMETGKSNAELLGADLSDPGTWPGISWVDYDPYLPVDHPRVALPYNHVLNIDLRSSLAGALDITGFPYLQLCWIVNAPGSAGMPGQYSSIRVQNNPKLTSVYLDYLRAGSVEIAGNPALQFVHLRSSKVGLLNLSAPSLAILRASTLGNPPINFAAYPELVAVDLQGIDNVTTLDLSGCPKLQNLAAADMRNLVAVRVGSMLNLEVVSLSDNPDLPSLDFRNAPKLAVLESTDNSVLTNLLVGNNPALGTVTVTGNPQLPSLNLQNLPSLHAVRCHGNEALKTLLLLGNPMLEFLYCPGNALETLDVSGLSALNWLTAIGNQLTQFTAVGVQFTNLNLALNRLQSASANVAGYRISATAYQGGGYVNFDASPGVEDQSKIFLAFDYQGLPDPRDTKLIRTEGTGLPEGYTWKSLFPVSSDVDATFFFGAVVTFMSYYATVEDNPWGELFGTAYPIVPTVGDPIGPMTPSPRNGFTFQGWYTDLDLTHPWDLEHDILEGKLTLFPNWLSEGAPTVVSVTRLSPASETVTTNRVTYRITFNEFVSGVDGSDFTLTTTGTALGKIARVSASQGNIIDVTVDTISGNGALRLDVRSNETQIVDAEGQALGAGFTQGETYTVGMGQAKAFAAFLQAHGIDPSAAGGALEADPDGDGVSNLLEFVLNGDPAVANAAVKPAVQVRKEGNSSVFDFQYNCSSAAAETYRIYTAHSTDLVHWQDSVTGQNGVMITEQAIAGGKVVTASFPVSQEKVFVQLRVE